MQYPLSYAEALQYQPDAPNDARHKVRAERDWSWLPVWYSAIVSPEQCEDNERWAEHQERQDATEEA